MALLRVLLIPLSWLYGGVMCLRNALFDAGILRERSFGVPVIAIGNLAVGGTGKTPHTEYVLRLLTGCGYKCAMLSRGYGRRTRGYVEAHGKDAGDIGDEPWQIQQKMPQVSVCVCEDRCAGIDQLLARYPGTEAIVLDDAFQHRYVHPGLSLLLTDYSRPYHADRIMPAGRLRESRRGAKRAGIVIVTKCPEGQETVLDRQQWRRKLRLTPCQHLFFTRFRYGEIYALFPEADRVVRAARTGIDGKPMKKCRMLIVCAIARPEVLVRYMASRCAEVALEAFRDHHGFSGKELSRLAERASDFDLVLTTEKDAARLSGCEPPEELRRKLCVQPIEVVFADKEQKTEFNQIISDYVASNKADC